MGVVLVGWVLFRAESFGTALHMLALMAGIGPGDAPVVHPVGEYWSTPLALALVAGVVLSFPVYRWIRERLPSGPRVLTGWAVFSVLFALASAKVLAGAYSPFLYFRF
jgi:alginate O-acetyltransferase complex protein AlgI